MTGYHLTAGYRPDLTLVSINMAADDMLTTVLSGSLVIIQNWLVSVTVTSCWSSAEETAG